MKFFKHFTDSHRGRSMQAVLGELGHSGHSVWWLLVELCAEKLTKHVDEEYTEAHCHFVFNERFLRDNLRLSGAKVVAFLSQYSTLALLSFKITGPEIHIHMPKLLESLDRDTKRARHLRVTPAPKRKRKREEKDKELIQKIEAAASRLAKKYQELFPKTTTGTRYVARLLDQIKSEKDLADLETSMGHYRRVLDTQAWRDPKTSFETYLGTKASGYFWRQFIDAPNLPAGPMKVVL